MLVVTADPTRELKTYWRINRDGAIVLSFYDIHLAAYSLTDVTLVANFKSRKNDSTNYLQLTESSGITKVTNSAILKITKLQASLFREQNYYWELVRTKSGLEKNWLTGDAEFHQGKFDGIFSAAQTTINSSEDMVIITIDEVSAGTGLRAIDFTAADDVYPTGTILNGAVYKSLNFAMYNGNGYPANTFFIALADSPTSSQWKLI